MLTASANDSRRHRPVFAHVRSIWVLLAAFFVLMVWFGAEFHPLEEVNSAEWDEFVLEAETIRQGHLPADQYRPLLFPIVAAGMGELVGDTFAGARLTSSLFAAIFVLSAYLIGRTCFSRSAGLFAAGAMMLNHNVIRYGVHATTDMMFAALAAVTIVAAVRAAGNPKPSAMLPVSIGFAATYFTRYAAVAILPAIIVAIVAPVWRESRRLTGARALAFAIGSIVCLLPHFTLTYLKFGDPFVNENWRNLAFKLYGNWDWTYLSENPFHGTLSVIAHDPLAFVSSAARESGKFVFDTLILLGGYAIAGGLFAAGTLAGFYSTLTALDRRRAVVVVYLVGYVLTICAFFYTSPRFMLPVLPACYAMVGGWLLSGPFSGWIDVRGRKLQRSVPVVALFLLFTAAATAREIPIFVSMHPVDELRAVQRLEREYGERIVVLGTAPYFQRHLGCEYRRIKLPSRGAERDDQSVYTELAALAHDVDFVVIGRLTGRGMPEGLVDGTSPPAFLDAVEITDKVAVYRVRAAGEAGNER